MYVRTYRGTNTGVNNSRNRASPVNSERPLLGNTTKQDRRRRACTLNIPATYAEDSVTPSLNSAEYLHYNGTARP